MKCLIRKAVELYRNIDLETSSGLEEESFVRVENVKSISHQKSSRIQKLPNSIADSLIDTLTRVNPFKQSDVTEERDVLVMRKAIGDTLFAFERYLPILRSELSKDPERMDTFAMSSALENLEVSKRVLADIMQQRNKRS